MHANNPGPAGSGRFACITLVVLQFAVSIALGIAAAVVFAQISFARDIDLGFRKDNMLVVIGNGLLTLGGQESFIQQLRSRSRYTSDVAMIGAPPASIADSESDIGTATRICSRRISLYQRAIGANAVQLLGMKLVAGRLLSDQRAEDHTDTSNISAGARIMGAIS